jgi:hypothetical protein
LKHANLDIHVHNVHIFYIEQSDDLQEMEDEGWDEDGDTGPLTPATPADQLQTECTCLTLDKIGILVAFLRLLKQYNDDAMAAGSASLRQYLPMLCGIMTH